VHPCFCAQAGNQPKWRCCHLSVCGGRPAPAQHGGRGLPAVCGVSCAAVCACIEGMLQGRVLCLPVSCACRQACDCTCVLPRCWRRPVGLCSPSYVGSSYAHEAMCPDVLLVSAVSSAAKAAGHAWPCSHFQPLPTRSCQRQCHTCHIQV
jgi:hypothetical protein